MKTQNLKSCNSKSIHHFGTKSFHRKVNAPCPCPKYQKSSWDLGWQGQAKCIYIKVSLYIYVIAYQFGLPMIFLTPYGQKSCPVISAAHPIKF